MTVVDLTHTIRPGMPTYPGVEGPQFAPANTLEQDGFVERRLVLTSHLGTHADAPAHILPGAPTLDQFAAGSFVGEGVLLDLRRLARPTIEVGDLQAAAASIRRSEFVLLWTGWSERWGGAAYFEGYPVLSGAAAEWLTSQRLKGVGVDAISFDVADSADFPVHRVLLGHGLVIIENLTNLAQLPSPTGFLFACLPLKLDAADGAPVRAVALMPPTSRRRRTVTHR